MSDLNRLLRSTIKRSLAIGQLPVWIQRLRTYRCLSVMTYHSVIAEPLPFADWSFLDESMFRRQIAYLREHFAILPLAQAIDLVKNDALERPSVAITFDDGFANNFAVAFPLLREFQAPATVYLTTDLIGGDQAVWFTRLIAALHATDCRNLRWNGGDYPLTDVQAKARSSALLQEALKRFPAARLDDELAGIEAALAVPPNPRVPEGSPFRMLTPAMIREMQASGLIEFGAHTCSHTILSRLSVDEQREQIGASIRRVEELTGARCRTFAYPNGARIDFDAHSQRLLAEFGVEAALTMIPGVNRAQTGRMEIHRYPIGADTDFSRFRLMAHNVI